MPGKAAALPLARALSPAIASPTADQLPAELWYESHPGNEDRSGGQPHRRRGYGRQRDDEGW
jgi:hypothetical protein